MTDSYANATVDLDALAEQQEDVQQTIQDQELREGVNKIESDAQQASDAQFAAEQDDPRNKEKWGMGGVVKELQSAFLGGIQDTGSSIVTAPERVLDMINGEM